MAEPADLQRSAERMAAVARGDARAFREIWDEHHERVFRIAAGVTLDRDEARDISQEVFVALKRAAPKWQPRAAIDSWLYRVAVNRALSFRRRLRRAAKAATGMMLLAVEVDPGTEARIVRAEAVSAMRAAVRTLPPAGRAVVTLALDTGLSPSEIAEVLGIEAGAARVRLHRAIDALREALTAAGVDSTSLDLGLAGEDP